MSFFIDAYWTKFHIILFGLFEAPSKDYEERIVDKAIEGLVGEVEPLLKDTAPFWGGNKKLTLAEVITGPFVTRAITLSKHGIYPESLNAQAKEKTPYFFAWAAAVSSHQSITSVFDEDVHVARSLAKRTRMRKAAGLE